MVLVLLEYKMSIVIVLYLGLKVSGQCTTQVSDNHICDD